MASNGFFLLLAVVALASSHAAMAADPSNLQDFCVADLQSNIFVNGFTCKDPKMVSPNDFFFDGLAQPGNTANPVGSMVTPAFVEQFPGLNTLGISVARIDFAPYGINSPHIHPRASEVLTVLKGTLLVGFITSNPENRLIAKVLKQGEIFAFPEGLIHFQYNIGKQNAVALASLSSQNPGVITVANAVFGSDPPIDPNVLAKAFQLDETTVQMLLKNFSATSH